MASVKTGVPTRPQCLVKTGVPARPQRPARSPQAATSGRISPLLILSLGLAGVLVLATIGVVRALGGRSSGGDLEARLARLEEQIADLGSRGGTPRFLVDPSQPAERAQVSEAVAALSKELGELRARVEGDGDRRVGNPKELATSTDAGARRRSVRALRELAKTDPEARRMLSSLLRDPEARVRREALEALARMRDPGALGEVKGMLTDKDPGVRGEAANALGEMARASKDPGERTQVAQALEGLLGDERNDVRKDAVEALREMGGRETAAALTKALADKSFEVQEEAIEGLARAGDPSSVAALRQAYGDGSGPNALEAAIVLKKLGDPSAFQKEAERLRTVLQQPSSADEKQEALSLLVEHSPQEAQALIDRALRDPSDSVRREAQRLRDRSQRSPR